MTLEVLQAKCDAHCSDLDYGNCYECNINKKKNDILNANKRRMSFRGILQCDKNVPRIRNKQWKKLF